MARRRFFVDEVRQGLAELSGEQAEHAVRVLRIEAGQQYEISDNERVYLARVTSARKGQVVFETVEEIASVEPPVALTLYLSLIKFDRMELVFEKATELGVELLIPVIARRSEKGLEKAAGKRMRRWHKVVLEASQQSRRARLPEIDEPVKFRDAIADAAGLRLLLDEEASASGLMGILRNQKGPTSVALLIGPEGGWTDGERNDAISAGWQPASLGPQILRTETAAMAATAVIMCVRGSPD